MLHFYGFEETKRKRCNEQTKQSITQPTSGAQPNNLHRRQKPAAAIPSNWSGCHQEKRKQALSLCRSQEKTALCSVQVGKRSSVRSWNLHIALQFPNVILQFQTCKMRLSWLRWQCNKFPWCQPHCQVNRTRCPLSLSSPARAAPALSQRWRRSDARRMNKRAPAQRIQSREAAIEASASPKCAWISNSHNRSQQMHTRTHTYTHNFTHAHTNTFTHRQTRASYSCSCRDDGGPRRWWQTGDMEQNENERTRTHTWHTSVARCSHFSNVFLSEQPECRHEAEAEQNASQGRFVPLFLHTSSQVTAVRVLFAIGVWMKQAQRKQLAASQILFSPTSS